jgi:hypothetical protein
MSERAAAVHFGVSRASVKKFMGFSVPPGYRRTAEIKPSWMGSRASSTNGCLKTSAGTASNGIPLSAFLSGYVTTTGSRAVIR